MIILFLVFVSCAIYLFKYFWESKKSEEKVDELKELIVEEEPYVEPEYNDESTVTDAKKEEYTIPYVDVDGVSVQKKFVEIYKRNNDFVGWLLIQDTPIDYPVMQSMYDEEYYIHKDFDKEYSTAGTLFVDTESDLLEPSDNIVIYGHNMKTGKMFNCLLDYEDEEFYKEHKYIQFNTIHGNNTYEIIAAFRTKIYAKDYNGFKYYKFFDADNEEEFMNYVNNCKNLTGYDIPTTANYGDKLITLSTCAYHVKDGRFFVVGKRID
jgi:sortase B